MTTRAEIVEAARAYIGTPFVHQARVKGVGIDCVGLVIGVARELGLSEFDTADYARQPDPRAMREELDRHLDRIAFADVLPGDIVWLRVEGNPQHLAIVSALDPQRIVHALNRPGGGACCEHRMSAEWRQRIQQCYRYRGVA